MNKQFLRMHWPRISSESLRRARDNGFNWIVKNIYEVNTLSVGNNNFVQISRRTSGRKALCFIHFQTHSLHFRCHFLELHFAENRPPIPSVDYFFHRIPNQLKSRNASSEMLLNKVEMKKTRSSIFRWKKNTTNKQIINAERRSETSFLILFSHIWLCLCALGSSAAFVLQYYDDRKVRNTILENEPRRQGEMQTKLY